MLDQITPVVLTYNEAPNIARCLARLGWAREVVVVDSGSDDGTQRIVAGFANARLVERAFDSHSAQWSFALHGTGIATPWALRLDADFVLEPGFEAEISGLSPAAGAAAYSARFVYCVEGRRLRASLYPPMPVLLLRAATGFRQDGHTEKAVVDGPVAALGSAIAHDDRKPLERWLRSQAAYQSREADKLLATPWRELGWPDRLRLTRVLGPPAVLLHCLLGKGLLLDGRAGLHYAFQRAAAETILSLELLRRDLGRAAPPG